MPLSARQMEYLALAWQCFETEPKINYEKFREVSGLTSAASARELMRVTKNKLRTEYGALGDSVRNSKTPSGTPQKKTNNGAATPSTAQGKKRARAPASASAKKNGNGLMAGLGMIGEKDAEGEDDEEEIEYEVRSPSKKKAKVNGVSKAVEKTKKTVTTNGDDDCENDAEAGLGAEAGFGDEAGFEEVARIKAEPKPSDFGLEDAPGGGWFN